MSRNYLGDYERGSLNDQGMKRKEAKRNKAQQNSIKKKQNIKKARTNNK